MKIVFMGTPDFAAHFLLHLHRSPHQIVGVVTQPDRPAGRGRVLTPPPVKVEAERLGYPILQPMSVKDPEFAAALKAFSADLFVVVAFSILPKPVLAASKLGAVNVHGSILPKYRGAAPVQWAIADGNKKTGVTVFLLDEKMDHGPILEQREISIDFQDTTASLLDKMVIPACDALDCALARLESGAVNELPSQVHAEASPAPKIKKEDGLLCFAQSAEQLHNRIRAFNPWPGGYTTLSGKIIYFRKTDVSPVHKQLAPGEGKIEGSRLFVGTADGVLEVIEIQLEGKRAMPVSDFIKGLQTKEDLCFKTLV
jgi:methionyl-tRNA formyltransferase